MNDDLVTRLRIRAMVQRQRRLLTGETAIGSELLEEAAKEIERLLAYEYMYKELCH